MAIIKVADLGISSGVATPAFQAYLSANQSISNNTVTKLQINTEVFDTDGCYDNATNYRFTPTVSGKYFLFGQSIMGGLTSDLLIVYIYKNGSQISYHQIKDGSASGGDSASIQIIDEANGTSDYYELFIYQNSGGSLNASGNATERRTFFGAYRIIGA